MNTQSSQIDRRFLVLLILTGFFVTNAIIAEVIGVKLFEADLGPLGKFVQSNGIILWPVVFLTTDLLNEFYGPKVVRTLSFMTAGLIIYAFAVIFASMEVPAWASSPVSGEVYDLVFGQSMMIIVGSITAFIFSQLIDVFIFWAIRNKTGGKMIWLRATGSTVISQFIDTFVVQGIAFYLPGKLSLEQFVSIAFNGYIFKFLVAVALTPMIYLGHAGIKLVFEGRGKR